MPFAPLLRWLVSLGIDGNVKSLILADIIKGRLDGYINGMHLSEKERTILLFYLTIILIPL